MTNRRNDENTKESKSSPIGPIVPVELRQSELLQFDLQLLVLPLQVHDHAVQEVDLRDTLKSQISVTRPQRGSERGVRRRWSFTCPSANSFSSLSCSRAASPAETIRHKHLNTFHLLHNKHVLTRERRLQVVSFWGLPSHEPLLQTVNAALQLSFIPLQRLHGRLQRLGHGVFPSQHRDLQRRDKRLRLDGTFPQTLTCVSCFSTSVLRLSSSRSLSETPGLWKLISPSLSLQTNVQI